jgi:nucleoside-diphosphate-sugar epimerase
MPVNIGNPEEHTILEFARIILKMIGGRSKIVFKDLPVDDPKQRRPDIGKARGLLGWEPKVGLEEGLRETIEYFKGCPKSNFNESKTIKISPKK